MPPAVMHPSVVAWLRCPVCAGPLAPAGQALRCARRHSFDLARQGYVDLVGGSTPHTGDTSEMVAARSQLLAGGHLDLVTSALIDSMPEGASGLAVEVGAGTAHHLAHLVEARPGLSGLAVDVSKAALRRAGRAHPRIAAVRADVWRGLPVVDGAATAVLDVFAPRSPAEFHRILAGDGALVVVTAGPDHLQELVRRLGLISVDPAKPERLTAGLAPWFVPAGSIGRSSSMSLSRADARALVLMGPNAWHLDPVDLDARLGRLAEPITVTASIRLSRWHPRPIDLHRDGRE